MKDSFANPLMTAVSLIAVLSSTANAAFIAAPDVSPGASSYDGSITNNLIRSGQSSFGGVVVSNPPSLPAGFTTAGLNDGSGLMNANLTYYATNGTVPLPTTITFTLAGSATGYDINSIQSIAGWGDSNIGDQKFQLLLSTNNVNYVDYGTYTNTSTINGGNFATRTTLTGDVVSGVTSVRFIFLNPGTVQGGSGGTLIRELQVFGTPTVIPEPSAALLLGFGGLVIARRRVR